VKAFPTAADLDSVVPGRPVVLERVDGHAIVANTSAMKAAGVTPATPSPPGGRIENGLFVDNAMELIGKAVPPATATDSDAAMAKAQDILLSYGVTGVGSSVAYAASKGALNTLTKSLARSLAPEVRVNAVCPGFIGTRWFSDRFGDEGYTKIVQHAKDSTPLHRAGTPEDVADAVVFLCAEGAQHITGETLLSDAGHHLTIAGVTRR